VEVHLVRRCSRKLDAIAVETSAANSTLRRKTRADHALTLRKVAQQPLCLRKVLTLDGKM
jgi:hypothetical protein